MGNRKNLLFETRQQRRKRRRLQRSTAEGGQVRETTQSTTTKSSTKSFNKPLVVGKRSITAVNGNPRVSAAQPHKAVYCVGNLSQTTTDTTLRNFVQSLGVRVVSCFEVKPRLTQWQRERQIQPAYKTFRLCINRADNKQLLNAESWPEDIFISRWFFKAAAVKTNSEVAEDGHDTVNPNEQATELAAAGDNDAEDMDETIMAGDLGYPIDHGMKSTPT